jgi:3-oxoacyl-[acyl-carrier protein] reductase
VTVAARTRREIDAVASECGGRAIELDLLDERSIERCVREAGRVDVLVNNAAAFASGEVATLGVAQFDRVIGTNLRGTFLLTKALLPPMIERRDGDVVMVSSTSGKRPNAGGAAYAASKFALNGFAHALFLEVRKHGIRVVCVSPSAVDTPERGRMRENRLQAGDVADAVVAALSLPRRASVHDVELWATNP